MASLRQRMLEDMQVRRLSACTQRAYVETVARFARYFDRSPARLGPEQPNAGGVPVARAGTQAVPPETQAPHGVTPRTAAQHTVAAVAGAAGRGRRRHGRRPSWSVRTTGAALDSSSLLRCTVTSIPVVIVRIDDDGGTSADSPPQQSGEASLRVECAGCGDA